MPPLQRQIRGSCLRTILFNFTGNRTRHINILRWQIVELLCSNVCDKNTEPDTCKQCYEKCTKLRQMRGITLQMSMNNLSPCRMQYTGIWCRVRWYKFAKDSEKPRASILRIPWRSRLFANIYIFIPGFTDPHPRKIYAPQYPKTGHCRVTKGSMRHILWR